MPIMEVICEGVQADGLGLHERIADCEEELTLKQVLDTLREIGWASVTIYADEGDGASWQCSARGSGAWRYRGGPPIHKKPYGVVGASYCGHCAREMMHNVAGAGYHPDSILFAADYLGDADCYACNSPRPPLS